MKETMKSNSLIKSKGQMKDSLDKNISFNNKKLINSISNIEGKNRLESSGKQNKLLRQSKSMHFDKLYEQAKELKSKIEKKRSKLIENLKKKSIPKILNISKSIQRNPNLFSERLYPYHKLARVEDNESEEEDKEYEYVHVATVRSNPLGISGDFYNEENKNNKIDNIFVDVEEIKTLYGDKPDYVKFYRGIKNKKMLHYSFKPEINKSKRNSNSLEYSVKKSEEKKMSKSFHSNSPCKKIHDLNYGSHYNSRDVSIDRNSLQFPKEKIINEFKENEENKNNIPTSSLNNNVNKNGEHIGKNSSLKKSKENINDYNKIDKNVLFENNDNQNLKNFNIKENNDEMVEVIKKKIKIDNHEIKKSIVYSKNNKNIKNYDFFLNGKKMKEDSIKISDKLYSKGITLLKKKEKFVNEKHHLENEEMAKFTFMPNLKKTIFNQKDEYKKSENLKKNNSFTTNISKSFDNMRVNFDNNSKNSFPKQNVRKNLNCDKEKKREKSSKNHDNPNKINSNQNNIEIINNINNKIKKSNQWNFSNKNVKKIFDSAYIALIKNFNSDIVNKVNNNSHNDYSTNTSNNQLNINKNSNNKETDSQNKSHSHNQKENYILNNIKFNCIKTKEKNEFDQEKTLLKRLSDNYLTVIDKRPIKNTGIYERCKKWKENNNKIKRKMREENEKEESKSCNFSPLICKKIIKDYDDKYIKNETKYIDEYLKRRRSSLEKIEDQDKFAKKIFGKSFDKYSKIKITQPKEFTFSHSMSRKSKEMKNNPKNLHKPEKVKEFRKEFNTSNFFNQSIVEYEETFNHHKYDDFKKINEENYSNNIFSKINHKNYLNLSLNIKKNDIIDKNRKLFNDNLKMNKKLGKTTINNINSKKNENLKINKDKILNNRSKLENIDENLKQEDTSREKIIDNEENVIYTNPAEEYDEKNENNLDEKLLNKNMNVKLI